MLTAARRANRAPGVPGASIASKCLHGAAALCKPPAVPPRRMLANLKLDTRVSYAPVWAQPARAPARLSRRLPHQGAARACMRRRELESAPLPPTTRRAARPNPVDTSMRSPVHSGEIVMRARWPAQAHVHDMWFTSGQRHSDVAVHTAARLARGASTPSRPAASPMAARRTRSIVAAPATSAGSRRAPPPRPRAAARSYRQPAAARTGALVVRQ